MRWMESSSAGRFTSLSSVSLLCSWSAAGRFISLLCSCLCEQVVFAVCLSFMSKHWSKHWLMSLENDPHTLSYLHHWTPDGSGIALFVLARRNYNPVPQDCWLMDCWLMVWCDLQVVSCGTQHYNPVPGLLIDGMMWPTRSVLWRLITRTQSQDCWLIDCMMWLARSVLWRVNTRTQSQDYWLMVWCDLHVVSCGTELKMK